MIGWLFEKLTGPWGYVLAALNGAVVAGTVSWEAKGLLDARTVDAANFAVVKTEQMVETNRANGNAATVDALTTAIQGALAENSYLTTQSLKRYTDTVALTSRLSHVPKTAACVGSPAIRELLRSPQGAGSAAAGGPH